MSLVTALLLLFCVIVGSLFPWTMMMMLAGKNNNNSSISDAGGGTGTTSTVSSSRKPQQQQQYHHPVSSAASSTSAASAATTPVIGILAQPSSFAPNDYDYIAASYVKWLEVGGARSIAIPFDAVFQNKTRLDELLTQIHGILIPGGGSMIGGPPPPTVQYLLDKVLALNNAGHYFPVWGTCLGFEYLIRYVANCTNADTIASSHLLRTTTTRTRTRTTTRGTLSWNNNKNHIINHHKNKCPMTSGFDAENISLPLQQVVPWQLYKDMTIRHIVTTQNVTMNNHQLGMTVEDFYNHNSDDDSDGDNGDNSFLSKVWKVTSVNQDRQGRTFVSTIEPMEPDHFPFYGTQYHAEKNAFEYATFPNTNIPYEDINHSADAIYFSMTMATIFVQELAQRSVRANPSHVYKQTKLFPPVYTYPIRSGESFEEIHVIPRWKR